MATAVKSWEWLSDNDGWTLTNTSLNAFARDGSNGNPAGSIYGTEDGSGAGSTGYGTASQSPTWEDLGVPAGATVTAVQCTAVYTRAGLTVSDGFGSASFLAQIASSAASWGATDLFSRATVSSADGSWVSGSGSSVAVPAAAQASDTVLQLSIRLTCTRKTGAGTGVSAHLDGYELTITYTEASSDRTASGGLKVQLPLLGGSAANTPPARSGSGSLKPQLPLVTGTATNVPPARSASGGLTTQLPLMAGAATNVPPARSASGGLKLQLPLFAGNATSAVVREASGGLALRLPSLGGTASVERRGSGGLALQLPILSGTATNTPPARSAAGGLTLTLPSLGGTATAAAAEPRTAAGGLALSLPSLGGTAAQTIEALWFDGLNDVVPLGDLGVTEDGDFTFETICMPYDAAGTRYVLGESGTVARVGLGVQDGLPYALLTDDTGASAELTGTTAITDDELHYMALAAAGGYAWLYVDGVVADGPVALPAGAFTVTATTLGALASAGYWYGAIASYRAYPTALSATDIAAQYDAWLEWREYVANVDLTATLAGSGWRATLCGEGWSAALAANGWSAALAANGWTAETAREGFRATMRRP